MMGHRGTVLVVVVAFALAPVGAAGVGGIQPDRSVDSTNSVGSMDSVDTADPAGTTNLTASSATSSADRLDSILSQNVSGVSDEVPAAWSTTTGSPSGEAVGLASVGASESGRSLAVSSLQSAAGATPEPAFVFVSDRTGNITLVYTDGSTVDYGVGAQAIGPRTDVDGDGKREVPFVDSNNDLKIVDNDGETQTLASNAEKGKTKLGIGDWDGDGNRDVFFSSSNSNLMRVDWDEKGNPTEIPIAKSVGAILGVTDVTGDGIREVVYTTDSSSLYYVNATGEVLLSSSTLWGSNYNRGVGEPANFTTQSDYQFPIVTGNGETALMYPDATTSVLVSADEVKARKTTTAAADWTGDDGPETIFIWYKRDGSSTNVADKIGYATTDGDYGFVENASGGNFTAKPGPGLAGGVSTFEVRESETTSGKAANFQLSEFSASPNGSGGLVLGFNSTKPISDVTVEVDGPTNLTVENGSFTRSSSSGGYVYNATVAVDDGNYTVTFVNATAESGIERSPGTTRTPIVDAVDPSVSNVTLIDATDGDDAVADGDTVRVEANATGGNDLSVVADLSAFGAGVVTLSESNGQYVGTGTVTESGAIEGSQSTDVNATDYDGTVGKNTSGTITVDTTAPTIQSFEFVQSGTDLDVRVNTSEPLSALSITLGEDASGTLTLSDATNETEGADGPYVYVADVADADGLYDATLDTATDSTGNDGAASQSIQQRVNTNGPSVSDFRLVEDGQNVDLVFTASEKVGALFVDVDDSLDENRTIANSTNVSVAGGYEYTVNVSDGSDGTFNVTLEGIEDEFGTNGTAGQTAEVSVDTTAPTIKSFEFVQSGTDLDVRVNTSEPLSSLSIKLGEDASGTLTLSDATNETSSASGPYVYVADVAASDGLYDATLQTAADDESNDGAASQSVRQRVNTKGPSVSNFRLVKDGQNVDLVFNASEKVGALFVDVDGAVDENRTIDNSTNVSVAGGYEYTVNISDGTDGTFNVTLDGIEDEFGTNASAGQTAELSVDTTAPTVESFEFVQNGTDLDVRVNTSEPLSSLSVALGEDASGTLTLSDATNETTDARGPYVYVADVADSDGLYDATLQTAADDASNDGAASQSIQQRVNTNGPNVSDFRVVTDGQNVDLVFDASERVSDLFVVVNGSLDANRTAANATNVSVAGGYEYTVNVSDGSDGTFNVTLDGIEDEFGVNGSAEQTTEVSVDTAAPTVGSVAFTTSGQDVDVRVEANETLSTLNVSVTGAVSKNLTRSNFTRTTTATGYAFVADVSDGTDGSFTADLDEATDASGNSFGGTANDSVSVSTSSDDSGDDDSSDTDENAPSISDFAVESTGDGVRVTFRSDESLSALDIALGGVADGTLTLADFGERRRDGGFEYTTKLSSGDGTYTATLQRAVDAAGNDGATGATRSATLDTTAPTVETLDLRRTTDGFVIVVGTDERLAGLNATVTGALDRSLSLDGFERSGTTYRAVIPTEVNGTVSVAVTVVDDAGNAASRSSGEFRVSTVNTTNVTTGNTTNTTAGNATNVTAGNATNVTANTTNVTAGNGTNTTANETDTTVGNTTETTDTDATDTTNTTNVTDITETADVTVDTTAETTNDTVTVDTTTENGTSVTVSVSESNETVSDESTADGGGNETVDNTSTGEADEETDGETVSVTVTNASVGETVSTSLNTDGSTDGSETDDSGDGTDDGTSGSSDGSDDGTGDDGGTDGGTSDDGTTSDGTSSGGTTSGETGGVSTSVSGIAFQAQSDTVDYTIRSADPRGDRIAAYEIDVRSGSISNTTYQFTLAATRLAGSTVENLTVLRIENDSVTEIEYTVVETDGETVTIQVTGTDSPDGVRYAFDLPDASISLDVRVGTADPQVGENVTLVVTASNDGGADGETTVTVRSDGTVLVSETISVGAGGTETTEINVTPTGEDLTVTAGDESVEVLSLDNTTTATAGAGTDGGDTGTADGSGGDGTGTSDSDGSTGTTDDGGTVGGDGESGDDVATVGSSSVGPGWLLSLAVGVIVLLLFLFLWRRRDEEEEDDESGGQRSDDPLDDISAGDDD